MFHAPLSYIAIFFAGIIIDRVFDAFTLWIFYLFIIQVLSHLLFDFITSRTAGIMLLYPFSYREYSMFPLNKSYGDFRPLDIRNKDYPIVTKMFWKYYLKNKFLIGFEILILILGLISIFV